MSGRPLDELEAAVGAVVTVRLKSGETYRGTLSGYDQHMNLVLEDLEDGPHAGSMSDSTPDQASDRETASGSEDDQDTTIIRGDNVVSITL